MTTLDKLAGLLRRKAMTAAEISRALKCCKPSAYRRVRELKARGESVTEGIAPPTKAKTGPKAITYRLVR